MAKLINGIGIGIGGGRARFRLVVAAGLTLFFLAPACATNSIGAHQNTSRIAPLFNPPIGQPFHQQQHARMTTRVQNAPSEVQSFNQQQDARLMQANKVFTGQLDSGLRELPPARPLDSIGGREIRTFGLIRKFWSRPKVSPLYLLDGTVCRFVNLQPVCTTLTTTGVNRGSSGSSSSSSGSAGSGGSSSASRPSGGSSSGGGGSSSGGGSSGGGGSSSGGSGGSGGSSSGGSRPSGGSSGGGSGGSSGSGSSGGGSSGGGSSGGGSGGSSSRPQSAGLMSGSSVQFVASRNGQIALRPAAPGATLADAQLVDENQGDGLSAEASSGGKLVVVERFVGQPVNQQQQQPYQLFGGAAAAAAAGRRRHPIKFMLLQQAIGKNPLLLNRNQPHRPLTGGLAAPTATAAAATAGGKPQEKASPRNSSSSSSS